MTLFTASLPVVFIWNPASTICPGLDYPHSHKLTLMVNVLQLHSMLQLEGPKATLTHFLQKQALAAKSCASARLQNTVSTPRLRLLFPLCPLYFECIVNTVNANMVLEDKKQFWIEVKCPEGCCLRDVVWLQSDGTQAFGFFFFFKKNGFSWLSVWLVVMVLHLLRWKGKSVWL